MGEWLTDTISYDHATPLGAVYDDSSTYSLMHQLFDDFITLSPLPETWTKDFEFADKSLVLSQENDSTPSHGDKRAASKAFAEIAKTMPKRKFIMYSPLDPPYIANPLTYIMNSPTIAHAYEHKRYFRDEFADLVNIPPYELRWLTDLTKSSHDEFSQQFGKYVIQDVESSGSKGTFIIDSQAKYDAALDTLKKTSYSGSIVVSKFINGQPYSVQVCITQYGVFTGGLQRQLVDSKYLCNLNLPGVSRWCGGELGGKYPQIIRHRTQEIATVLGSELASHGYRGIFGIDLLITPEDEVYAIEINARLTGYTHVLSDMQYAKSKIPFILMHTLELGNYKYEINDLEALPSMSGLSDKFSYLILNNQHDESWKLTEKIRVGLYEYSSNELKFLRSSCSVKDIENDNQILLFCKYEQGAIVERGKRVLKVILKGDSMADDGDLNGHTAQLMETIKRTFKLPQQP